MRPLFIVDNDEDEQKSNRLRIRKSDVDTKIKDNGHDSEAFDKLVK